MNNDLEPLDLAIDATSTDDLLRIVGTDRPRYSETLIIAAEEELKNRGYNADEQDHSRTCWLFTLYVGLSRPAAQSALDSLRFGKQINDS